MVQRSGNVEGWKAAVRQYEQVRKRIDDEARIDIQHAACRNWLDKHVIPAIDEYWHRPVFQEQAAATIRAFTRGESPETSFVNSLDASFRSFAKSLLGLADRRLVARRLSELDRSTAMPHGAVWIGGNPEQIQGHAGLNDSPCISELDVERNQVRVLAASPQPLVSTKDYFEPRAEFVKAGSEWIQRGDMVVSVTNALMPIGDFIVWLLIRRSELHAQILKSFHNRVMHAVSATSHSYRNLQAEITNTRQSLNENLNQLRPMFQLGNANRLRHACVVLAQVYAAFQKEADCAWLGLDQHTVAQGRTAVQQRLRSYRSLEAFDQIAKSLQELRNLYEDAPASSGLDEAISFGKLVIERESKDHGRLWWETEKITKPLPKHGFKALLLLAQRAPRRQPVDEEDVYGDTNETSSRYATMISRLREALPGSLSPLIKTGKPKRNYLMELDADRIHIV